MRAVHIVAPYPPPYGGVAVHVARLLPHLRAAGIPYRVFSQYDRDLPEEGVEATHGRKRWWLRTLVTPRDAVLHLHYADPAFLLYGWVYGHLHGGRLLITVHNETFLRRGALRRALSVALLRTGRQRRTLVVSDRVRDHLVAHGVEGVEYLPAYVPPDAPRRDPLLRSGKQRSIAWNAARLDTPRAREVYGYDLLLVLADRHPECRFTAYLGGGDPPVDTPPNLEVVVGQDLASALHGHDLFLRLNREDGYGVSVQEALDCGLPAIASDVCRRPRGAVLFPSGDIEALQARFSEVTRWDEGAIARQVAKAERPEHHRRLLSIYAEVLERLSAP